MSKDPKKIPFFSQGTFSIVAAPHEALLPAIASTLPPHEKSLCLYLCGNYPVLLPKLDRRRRIFHVRRAINPYQVFEILDESRHSLILFEHDPGLYDGEPELAEAVGMKCRETAEDAAVVLFHKRFDSALSMMERYADRVVVISEADKTRPIEKARATRCGQTTLGSWKNG
ncbi:MAG: hypothetical protein JW931_01555 [Methanomicrobiaceae archaeon]|nr:hypothetical protein [Methanomicrobiaceae archaeon]